MYTVVIHRRAARYLKKLPQDQQTKVRHVLGQIRNHPFGLPGIKAMIGDWAGYRRVQVGNIRIIFWVDEDQSIIYVDHSGPRGDIYKGGA